MRRVAPSLALAVILALVLALNVAQPLNCVWANVVSDESVSEIVLGKSHIRVEITTNLDLPRSAVLAWVRRSATAVARYYGHFPVEKATIQVTSRSRPGLGFATTDSDSTGEGGLISVPVGYATTQEELDKDWVLTHEMVHLAFPLVYPKDRWLVEGMATYIEPLARMQAGYITREEIWGDLVDGLPKGLPHKDDEALADHHNWGRIYWGGALFCLMSDLEIRRSTGNKKGLQNALRAIDSHDGDVTSDMEVEEALRLGDQAIGKGSRILENQYAKMNDSAIAPDLEKLWKELGVKKVGKQVTFDDNAPLAAARKAIDAGI